MKLLQILLEAIQSIHYKERKQERLTILKVFGFPEIWDLVPREEYEKRLKILIPKEYEKRAKGIESAGTSFGGAYIGLPIMSMKVTTGAKTQPLNVEVEYIKTLRSGEKIKQKQVGSVYVAVIRDNTVVTLLLTKPDPSAIEKEMIDHLERNGKSRENVKIEINTNFKTVEYVVDIEDIFLGGREITRTVNTFDADQVEYEPQTDYRADGVKKLKHKKYGEKLIVNTSSGKSGKGDANGRLDWVEILDPHVRNGQRYETRKIPNVKTKVYWDLHKQK